MTIRIASVFWVMPDTENYERKQDAEKDNRFERGIEMRKPIVTALSVMLSAAITLSLTATASYAQDEVTADTAPNTVQTQAQPETEATYSLKQTLNLKQTRQKHRRKHQRSQRLTRNRRQNQKRSQHRKRSRTPLPHCKPKARITPSVRP